jgi:hypothetical protein
MAEIIEAIHKITYEVNDAALQKAASAISAQIIELQRLNAQLQNLQQQLAQTANKEGAAFTKLSSDINNISQRIEQSGARIQGVFQQIGNGVIKGLGGMGEAENKVAKFTEDLITKLAGLEKFNGASIAALATDLFSFTNIAPLAISLVASVATELFRTSDAASAAEQSFAKFLDTTKNDFQDTNDAINTQANQLNLYKDLIKKYRDVNAASQLISQFPSLKDYKPKDIVSGKADDAINKIYAQIEAKEKANLALKKELDLQKLIADAEEQQAEALKKKNKAETAYKEAYTDGNTTDFNIELVKEAKDAAVAYQSATFFLNHYRALLKEVHKYTTEYAHAAGDLFLPPESTGNSNKSSVPSRSAVNHSKANKPTFKIPIPTPSDDDIPQELIPKQEDKPQPIQGESEESKKLSEQIKKVQDDDAAKAKEAQEKHRAEIKKTITTYQQLAHTAAEAFNSIYEAQVKALDAEIEIRKQRVDAATKLAERGNTEALRIEEERLAKAQKTREEYARRQQLINAALAVSDAIVAVAEAASETGAGAIAVVPAVIAAIIAGYAAVSAATRESSSFAEGVVAFKGKGGPKDDANWVRISSGESVITADGTQKNKTLLEAINKGQDVYQLLYHKNALAYPSLKVPTINSIPAFATKTEMKGVEEKLDNLIDAVNSNHTTVHNRMDENGWLSMTEKTAMRNKNKWRTK